MSCEKEGEVPNMELTEKEPYHSLVDSSAFNHGVLIYNADQGKKYWTEFGSEYGVLKNGNNVSMHLSLSRYQNNVFLTTSFSGLDEENELCGVELSLYKTLNDTKTIPDEIASKLSGISFNAKSEDQSVRLTVEAVGRLRNIIETYSFDLSQDTFKTYDIPWENKELKKLRFYVDHSGTLKNSGSFSLDDVYLKNGTASPFNPPKNESEILNWLKQSVYTFYDWNFQNRGSDGGYVSESWTQEEKISLSGIGFAYAIFVLSEKDGFYTQSMARDRILKLLKWQQAQNWFDGSGGWHGFPHHYFKPNGNYYWADVSTIDWAICAAGLRIVRQFYSEDLEITRLVDELLSRPNWKKALAENGKIAMGFEGNSGEMNPYRWGLAFSEETELVYLEAFASGDLPATIFDSITREKKSDYYPSWFGAGFTYNWLQLWTGPIDPYYSNSVKAYTNDASTSSSKFGIPIMGLTACSTIKNIDQNGFISWSDYISNQGGSIHGASSQVLQLSPAVYGASLALPFTKDNALEAFRGYIDLGFYHPYLGLPDNVRLKDFDHEVIPSPNWDHFDINIGPIALSIEQIQDNHIGKLYLSDTSIKEGLQILISSFPN